MGATEQKCAASIVDHDPRMNAVFAQTWINSQSAAHLVLKNTLARSL